METVSGPKERLMVDDRDMRDELTIWQKTSHPQRSDPAFYDIIYFKPNNMKDTIDGFLSRFSPDGVRSLHDRFLRKTLFQSTETAITATSTATRKATVERNNTTGVTNQINQVNPVNLAANRVEKRATHPRLPVISVRKPAIICRIGKRRPISRLKRRRRPISYPPDFTARQSSIQVQHSTCSIHWTHSAMIYTNKT